jgi:hypothetical protein
MQKGHTTSFIIFFSPFQHLSCSCSCFLFDLPLFLLPTHPGSATNSASLTDLQQPEQTR